MAATMDMRPLPDFFLYGEASQAADPDFIHIEDLALRSRPGEWRIAPHKHADLSHLILITDGGGLIQYEAEMIEFEGPRLLVVPARCVHGFEWHRESSGKVLTMADLQLQQIFASYPEFAGLFAVPRCIDLSAAEQHALDEAMQAIAGELSWAGLGQSAALQAGLLTVLVHAARRLQHLENAAVGSLRQRNLVARYRQLIEARFRLREPVGTYARELGVSETSLREACAAGGLSPAEMRDRRAMLEAQRLLAFSVLGIAQIGQSVGIADPAYFSRFFTRLCGMSPAQWRRSARQRKQLG